MPETSRNRESFEGIIDWHFQRNIFAQLISRECWYEYTRSLLMASRQILQSKSKQAQTEAAAAAETPDSTIDFGLVRFDRCHPVERDAGPEGLVYPLKASTGNKMQTNRNRKTF